MSNIEKILNNYSLTKEEVFEFLEGLRESGKINMFGATSPLQDFYGFSKIEAKEVLLNWIENYNN